MTNTELFLKESQGLFEVKKDVKMSEYTTFKIGGNTDLAIYPKTKEELEKSLTLLTSLEIPYYVVGKGSNLLVDDKGFRGAIVFTSLMNEIKVSENKVYACAGAGLTSLSRFVGKMGLSGMERLCGIPGSVGGAVYMNAGAYGSEMKDITVSSDYYSISQGFGTLSGEEQGFDYRKSAYTNSGKIIIGCTLLLNFANESDIHAVEEECLRARREKQPLEYASAGSTFKRYPGRYTGKMIEEAGLKGLRIGGAFVSEKHAGFIVSDGSATSSDVINLIKTVREKIFQREGIIIESEVKYLSEEGEKEI